jgi:GNAT superfamily N-acetyltransferase
VITRATADDIDTVLELVNRLLVELSDETSQSAAMDRPKIVADLSVAAERWTAFLAVDGRSTIGVITLTEAVAAYAGGRYGIISELYVDLAHRCRQVGAQLLAAVRTEGQARGWACIEVTAPPGPRWDRSVAFYERNGFVFTGRTLKLLLS